MDQRLVYTPDGKELWIPKNSLVLPYGSVREEFFLDMVIDGFQKGGPWQIGIIQGPIESGKSVVAAGCIYAAMCLVPRWYKGVRKSRWLVTRSCFDDKTEILTENGFKLFRDLEDGEKVAQLRDGVMEFVEPIEKYRTPYVGEMIGFESEGIDFRVTPDHRMYAAPRHKPEAFEFRTAEEIYGKCVRMRRDADWVGVDPGYSVDFFEWLGFWYAEGVAAVRLCSDGIWRYTCEIIQCKPEGIEYAKQLYDRIGCAYTINDKPAGGVAVRMRVTPETRPLIDELAKYGKSTTKWMAPWMKNAPKEHLLAFLKGFIAGDGSAREMTTVAYTSSRRLADDLQEIAIRCGIATNVTSRDRRGVAMCINGVATTPTAIEHTISFLEPWKNRPLTDPWKPRKIHRGWYRETIAGEVFCVQVPTHVICVRRNGKPFWCSQSYPELETSTIPTWLNWFPEETYGKFSWSEPYTHFMRFQDVEADVVFQSYPDDKPDTLKSLRSTEWTGAWVNEGQFMPRRLVMEMSDRTGRYPPAQRIMNTPQASRKFLVMDMNAPQTNDHWVLRMRGDVDLPEDMPESKRMAYVKPSYLKFYKQPPAVFQVRDAQGKHSHWMINPKAENLENMKPERYLQLTEGKDLDEVRRDLGNEVVESTSGAPCFPTWDRDRHSTPDIIEAIEGLPLYLGFDWGATPAMMVFQNVGGQWRGLTEIVETNCLIIDFARKVKAMLSERYPWAVAGEAPPLIAWGDPEGDWKDERTGKTSFGIMRASGITVRAPAPKDNPQLRLEIGRKILGETTPHGSPRLWCSRHPTRGMPKFCSAMGGGYVLKTVKVDGQEKLRSEPVKNMASHPAEAGLYVLWGGGEGQAVFGRTEKRQKLNMRDIAERQGKRRFGHARRRA